MRIHRLRGLGVGVLGPPGVDSSAFGGEGDVATRGTVSSSVFRGGGDVVASGMVSS